jgi:hypothetical protein
LKLTSQVLPPGQGKKLLNEESKFNKPGATEKETEDQVAVEPEITETRWYFFFFNIAEK